VKQIRKRLTYANVMSSIAVFLVLGGATALAANQLGKNTVGTKQLKKNSVTSAKVKNGSLLSSDFKAGQLPAGPQGARGLQGPQGPAGAQGPAGTALAYALVEAGGTVDPEGSKGIVSSDISLDNTGTYCFNKIPAGTKSIVATANGQFVTNANSDRFVSVSFIPTNPTPSWTGCASGEDPVRVTTFDLSVGGLTNSAFMVWFEG
jgi:hypothetical protein